MSRPTGVSPLVFMLMLLALIGMGASTVYHLTASTEPEQGKRPIATRDATAGGGAGTPPETPPPAMSESAMDALGQLMQTLQEKPNDAETLVAIGSIFLETGEWQRAEFFLTRAVTSRPGDTNARYRLGIALYQQDKTQEAAKVFEELLAIKEEPAAMFNLAMLYKYDLGNKERALELLKKVIALPETTEAIRQRANEEL